MLGQNAPEYIESRRALLDALECLRAQREAVIIAGAQAIYLRTGDSEYLRGLQPYTTDADLTLDPSSLGEHPALESAMLAAGFELSRATGTNAIEPGIWIRPSRAIPGATVSVDLIVPDGLAPKGGRRGARLDSHGHRAARKIVGLEACIVDNDIMRVAALEVADARTFDVKVAGVAALFVAKVHKIRDRLRGDSRRQIDKDASDVYRLMTALSPDELGVCLRKLLLDDRSAPTTQEALDSLDELFGTPSAPGVLMGVRALTTSVSQSTVEATFTTYTQTLGRQV